MMSLCFQVQMCLKNVGSFLRTIQIEPNAEFYNLFHFLRIWNMFIEYHSDVYPMHSLERFYFTFACESRDQSEVYIFGTGEIAV